MLLNQIDFYILLGLNAQAMYTVYILSLYSRLHISYSLYYSLCQLTQLEKLYIGKNPLYAVPEVVSSLTSLKELTVGCCKLSTLPERFVCHIFSIVSSTQ